MYPGTSHGNLLASILARYPQIGTLQVLPESRCMRLGFFVKSSNEAVELQNFYQHIVDSISSLVFLAGRRLKHFNIQLTRCEDLSIIELDRDLATISLSEISLVVSLMEEHFGAELLRSEEADEIEDPAWYDELIQHMLEDIGSETHLQRLIGFREGNRIMVFDKPQASGQ